MNIHEYQSKALLREYGVPVMDGYPAFTPAEAMDGAQKLGGGLVAVKAQIHAGGRGKAGGVKLARTPQEAFDYAGQLLGMTLVTKQTGPKGKKVRRLLIEKGCKVIKEYYLSMVIDSKKAAITVVASSEGGMSIEEVAEETPEKIVKIPLNYVMKMQPFIAYEIADKLGIPAAEKKNFAALMRGMYRLFTEKDCKMIEINPLALTEDEGLVALDAKISFDDAGLPRHKDIAAMRDRDEEETLEADATDRGFSFVSFGGDIACLGAGAGMGMATVDTLAYLGAVPGNFMDSGPHTEADDIMQAFDIVAAQPGIKVILVNYFAGGALVDTIAEGVVKAVKKSGCTLPIVVRLDGINVERAFQIIEDSGLQNIHMADSIMKAAQMAVDYTKERACA